ncbi:signal recognition particle subunit FFH/SRP54 (srp54) [Magnetococcus marinus MC-1]|uniref:Signal recognition particle protein n=1 Tax=Magnetococcus marinus (strain ATCC BAA-1437 / JCM 17883 / MC-1) TaxID=156889 RepID=A0L4Y5_MAGMM|nr:signal recognition particle protein [Magnetococcus marinus]ABK43028.1 signal recognition particle subunit FFH/SRP54 (srp54) [Magnetococcus marinus MC-1]
MFESLSDRLEITFKKLKGQGKLSEQNIKDALREVRIALLEADVNLNVTKAFIRRVQEKAIGVEVLKSLTPGQQVIKIVHDELVAVMGAANESLNLANQPPVVVMMAGLQGSGKTTSTAKLAKRLIDKERKKCLLASLDVYRPAAMKQLQTVGEQVGATVLPTEPTENPREIAKRALEEAKKGGFDVLFLDTAGRLHIDEALMSELADVAALVNPHEILFVADAMTGQDAVSVAKNFDDRLNITGVLLSKTDGDARGGAALSIREVTGKPIKFLGTGEKLDGLEPFHPDRVASRILGMGDVVSLVETAMEKVDLEETFKLQEKLANKKGFTLEDFLTQMQQVQKMGSISDLVGMIPGAKQAMKGKELDVDDKQIKRLEAIILSMTKKERQKHALINASRKRRIAAGSGTSVQEVNKLLKQFVQTQTMMKKLGGMGGLGKMMKGMKGLPKIPGLGGGGFPKLPF